MKYLGKWAAVAIVAFLAMAIGPVGLAVVDQGGYPAMFAQVALQAPLHGPPVSTATSGQDGQLLMSSVIGNALNVMGHCHLTAAQFGAIGLADSQPTATRSGEVGPWRSRPNLYSL